MKNNSKIINNFQKVLIANRGEIAVRIIKTAKKLGLKTVAVYSDADIGSGPASDSYLSIKNIIKAAKCSKAEAIHPGYGFLSENANFAKICNKENIIFIGADSNAIKKMGDKKIAKSIAIKAGVPCLTDFNISSDEEITNVIKNANKLGFPIMLKATKGGGGKGMRLVLEKKDLKRSINLAKSESFSAFGSDEIIMEKALLKTRHIEVQIFGDSFGNFIHLGERDCSIQRRHQKIIEEAPAKGISNKIRNQIGEEAIKLAKAIKYIGAGTIEFLMDQHQNFFFLEMNTRLQVEHPVTEMITGLDLVELQFLIADGQRLPVKQENINFHGYAIEARLYAEDPRNNFFPSFGKILEFNFLNLENIRIDNGIKKNQIISSFYDPMLAKVISFSNTRLDSISKLKHFLSNLSIIGIKSNRDFLIDILSNENFKTRAVNTSFIEETYTKDIKLNLPMITDFAVFAYMVFKDQFDIYLKKTSGIPKELQFWSNINNLESCLKIYSSGEIKDIKIQSINSDKFRIKVEKKDFLLELNDKKIIINKEFYHYNKLYKFNDIYFLVKDDIIYEFFLKNELSENTIIHSSGRVSSPMHGRISQIKAFKNKKVSKGEVLLVLEAMKMQHEIIAEIDGIIENIYVEEGSQVSTAELLLNISNQL